MALGVPGYLFVGVALLFTDFAWLSPVVIALTLGLAAMLLWRQRRAEQSGRTVDDWRAREEHKAWLRSLPPLARVAWYASFVVVVAFDDLRQLSVRSVRDTVAK